MSTILKTSQAFDKALSNFKSSLTDKERLDFAQTSIDDVYTETKNIQERQAQRGLLRNLNRIQPYLKGLVQFSGVIEVFVQVKPEIMAFIWGPTKFLLQKIGENLPRFKLFAEEFQNDSRIQEVVVMVYGDILGFYHSILKFFRGKLWKQIFKSLWCTFEDTFRKILSNLEQHRILLDSEAIAAHIVATRRDVLEDRDIRKLGHLKGWLNPIDYEAYLNGLDRPCLTTGAWLIQEDGVKVWLDIGDVTKRFLWLTGIPGSGKTFLSSFVLQHVRSQPHSQKSVVFAFLGDGNSSFAAIMRTLVFQLLQRNPQLLPYLNDIYESNYHPLTSRETLEIILETILGNIGITYLIIDGLDEIRLEERDMVLSMLLSLFSKADNLKIFVSSRLEVDILDALELVTSDIYRVDVGENNKTDIVSYVSVAGQAVHKRFSVDSTTREEIQQILDRVAHNAGGMFLWAKLVIYHLLQQFDLVGLEDAARNLPAGLDAAYGRILQRINENLSPNERDLARRVLGWVLCGTRPLRLTELMQALAIRTGERRTDPRRRLLIRLDELCGPILEIGVGEKVNFVHFTAKEYLTSTYSGPFIHLSVAHRDIASTCLSYLSFVCFDSDLSDEQVIENVLAGEYCLHEYAERNWLHHIRHATEENNRYLNDLINLFNRFIEFRRGAEVPHTVSRISSGREFPIVFDRWPEAHGHLVDCFAYYSGKSDPTREIPLKLQRPVERFREHLENLFSSLSLPKDNMQLQYIQRTYGTNLFKCPQFNCAHYFGGYETREKRDEHLQSHIRPFKCSVKECDFSSIGFASDEALNRHLRLYHQNLDTNAIISSLVEAKGSLEKSSDLSLILFDAIATGDRVWVESVLMQSPDITSTNANGETALYCALTKGSEEVLRLLLQQGAPPNQIVRKTGDPILHSAIRSGAGPLVQLLLDWGAEVDPRGSRDTALRIGVTIPRGEQIVKMLLAKGTDVNLKGHKGITALMAAAREGGAETVQLLLESGADVDARDDSGNTALIEGVRRSGGKQIVKMLLAKGANVNLKGHKGTTVLMAAAGRGGAETVQLLLESGADVDARDDSGNTALIKGAKRSGGEQIVKMLLAKGANVNLRGFTGRTALFVAAQSGSEETIQLLLESGADVDARDGSGNMALIEGAKRSNGEQIVKMLLAKGANVNLRGFTGRKALFVAAQSGSEETIQLLLESGADVDAGDDFGNTVLIEGVRRSGGEKIVKMLLAKGADVNLKGHIGTALIAAARERGAETVQLLLESGADVDARDDSGNTALIEGVRRSDGEQIVKMLLAKGADVNLKGHIGITALMAATGRGRAETVQLLLESGADVDARDDSGNTALIEGVRRSGGEQIFKMLLAKGADVNLKGHKGITALMAATGRGRAETVQLLLERGANVEIKDDDGDPALVVGARYARCVPAVKVLLEKGANINAMGKNGQTALVVAARLGFKRMTKALLEYGASVDVKDNDGNTPMTVARRNIRPLLQGVVKAGHTA